LDALIDANFASVPFVSGSSVRVKRRKPFIAYNVQRHYREHVSKVRSLLDSNTMLKFTILSM
jgi:hypothetical protein